MCDGDGAIARGVIGALGADFLRVHRFVTALPPYLSTDGVWSDLRYRSFRTIHRAPGLSRTDRVALWTMAQRYAVPALASPPMNASRPTWLRSTVPSAGVLRPTRPAVAAVLGVVKGDDAVRLLAYVLAAAPLPFHRASVDWETLRLSTDALGGAGRAHLIAVVRSGYTEEAAAEGPAVSNARHPSQPLQPLAAAAAAAGGMGSTLLAWLGFGQSSRESDELVRPTDYTGDGPPPNGLTTEMIRRMYETSRVYGFGDTVPLHLSSAAYTREHSGWDTILAGYVLVGLDEDGGIPPTHHPVRRMVLSVAAPHPPVVTGTPDTVNAFWMRVGAVCASFPRITCVVVEAGQHSGDAVGPVAAAMLTALVIRGAFRVVVCVPPEAVPVWADALAQGGDAVTVRPGADPVATASLCLRDAPSINAVAIVTHPPAATMARGTVGMDPTGVLTDLGRMTSQILYHRDVAAQSAPAGLSPWHRPHHRPPDRPRAVAILGSVCGRMFGCRCNKPLPTHKTNPIKSTTPPQTGAGGTDHPRNYVAMHAGLNGSFAERLPECKLVYVEAHSPTTLRRVHAFVTELRTSPLTLAAERHVMRSWTSATE